MTRRAFSIIELVIVIGIIVILIGLLLPALSGTKASATATVLAADMQQLARVNDMYCDDHDGFYAVSDARPDFVPPDMTVEAAREFGLGRSWPHALRDAGLIDNATLNRWFVGHPIYWSATMYIDPRHMTSTTIQPWETLATTSVARAWALYPSDKFLFGVSFVPSTDGMVLWNQHGTTGPLGPVVGVDGSVSMIRAAELLAPDPAPILDYGSSIIFTWDGIRGRDR